MNKDISLAVMATILLLQLVAMPLGWVSKVSADAISKFLASQIQIEQVFDEEE